MIWLLRTLAFTVFIVGTMYIHEILSLIYENILTPVEFKTHTSHIRDVLIYTSIAVLWSLYIIPILVVDMHCVCFDVNNIHTHRGRYSMDYMNLFTFTCIMMYIGNKWCVKCVSLNICSTDERYYLCVSSNIMNRCSTGGKWYILVHSTYLRKIIILYIAVGKRVTTIDVSTNTEFIT